MLITYYIICCLLYIGITIAVLIDKHSKPINTSKPIPEPQIETKAEYYYKKNEYGHDITSTKYALTEEDKPYLNDKGKWMLNNVSGEISEPIIERKYNFFGFNGLDKCQYPDKVPKDLAPFIREPFDNWYYTGKMKPYKDHGGSDTDYFNIWFFGIDTLSNKDSVFRLDGASNSFVETINHTIEMDYRGPKYLLEKDEDFYVNKVECPLQEEKRFEYKSKTYYLHFNPVKKYITLYTDKMNTKEN
ncbi:MAG: hypothetical protein ABZF75_00605 [Columbia Basin potato purple top phytoplasma]